jgi:hypothetical protein
MQDATERRDAGPEDARDADKAETRPQQAGEGGTTRFGMEDGDNTDVAATGGPQPDEEEAAHPS